MARPMGPRFQFNCVVCGKSFERRPCDVKRGRTQYCSTTCSYTELSAKISGKKNGQWKHGKAIREKLKHYNRKRCMEQAGPLLAEDVADVIEKCKGVCMYCEIELDFENGKMLNGFHLEHIHPLIRGGTNKRYNLGAACCSCNSSKGGKTVREWSV